ncbi:MAG: redoxin domain-containing protein, partial [Nitrospinaceae bacterium]|nr:redoxin domain-containing protein [Nitrospinaceae bacterium]
MAELSVGDMAPDFTLRDQSGDDVRLSDFRGRKVLVYFYPKANTPGCTIQSCSVRDSLETLDAGGISALGISPDAPGPQSKFDTKYKLG